MCYDNSYMPHMYISWLLKTWWWSDKGPKHVVLLSNKDNKDTYFVVFDSFVGKPTAYTYDGRRVTQHVPDPPLCGAPRGNEIRTKFANLTPGAKPGRFYNRISPAKWLIHFFRFTRRIKVYWAFLFLRVRRVHFRVSSHFFGAGQFLSRTSYGRADRSAIAVRSNWCVCCSEGFL